MKPSGFDKMFTGVGQDQGPHQAGRKSVTFKKEMLAHHGFISKTGSGSEKSSPDLRQHLHRGSPGMTFGGEESTTTWNETVNPSSSPTTSARRSSRRKSSAHKLNRARMLRIEEDQSVKLLSRPQEKFFDRVEEIEKLAK